MKKGIAIALMTLALTAGVGFSMNAEASWLSKVLDKVGTGGGTSTQATTAEEVNKSDRWEKVYQGEKYTIYADRRTLVAKGSAQDRKVIGYFKRVYTPEESYNLGINSNGYVKPDTITHCIYKAEYGVNKSTNVWWESGNRNAKYYDANSHLIYEGFLSDFDGEGDFGTYTPDSENEKVKDILFKAFGMDY